MSALARVLLWSVAALVLVLVASACGTGSHGRVIARVGGATITENDLRHWTPIVTEIGASGGEMSGSQTSFVSGTGGQTPAQRTLAFLIAVNRTIAQAGEQGLSMSNAQAKTTLERLAYEHAYGGALLPDDAALRRLLSSPAESRADKLRLVKAETLAVKLGQRRVAAAEAEIPASALAAYYAEHKRRFVVPERRKVYVIQSFKKPNADQARREIEQGRSLAVVVERRNQEPAVGGVKVLSRDHLDHTYEENFFTAKPHVFVGPLKYEMYYLFEVTKIFPPRQKTLAEAQVEIRHELISGAKRSLLTGLVAASDAKWRARTRCDAAYLLPQCGARRG